jgi:predicted phosphate transport protein (TIGR00153 family)
MGRMQWFQALLPREQSFFDKFAAHAQLLVQGAEQLRAMLGGGEAVAPACAEIVRCEAAADEIAQSVFQAIRRTFVTPFDRGDIRDLATALDDAINQMQKAAKAVVLFDMRAFRPEMQELGDLAIQAAFLTLEAVELLRRMSRNAARLNAIAEAVARIESRSDEVYDNGMKALLAASRDRPMDFIAGSEVFDHLEKIIDRFKNVSSAISGILIEHL